jgi:uncharacterized protein (DUF2461 family)
MKPARQFVLAMGEQLRQIAPGVHAEPEVNRSIFRIHRDTRFSKDKTPYKTNLELLFWEGEGHRMECPGFYSTLRAAQYCWALASTPPATSCWVPFARR